MTFSSIIPLERSALNDQFLKDDEVRIDASELSQGILKCIHGNGQRYHLNERFWIDTFRATSQWNPLKDAPLSIPTTDSNQKKQLFSFLKDYASHDILKKARRRWAQVLFLHDALPSFEKVNASDNSSIQEPATAPKDEAERLNQEILNNIVDYGHFFREASQIAFHFMHRMHPDFTRDSVFDGHYEGETLESLKETRRDVCGVFLYSLFDLGYQLNIPKPIDVVIEIFEQGRITFNPFRQVQAYEKEHIRPLMEAYALKHAVPVQKPGPDDSTITPPKMRL